MTSQWALEGNRPELEHKLCNLREVVQPLCTSVLGLPQQNKVA